MRDWQVRPFQPEDLTELVDLHNRVFRTQTDAPTWYWKHHSRDSTSDWVWVATAGGKIIGQYAGIPVTFWQEGQNLPAILVVDAVVAPEFRRQGVLTELVTHAHKAWKQMGMNFAYGLPNQQWGSRLQALGFEPYSSMVWQALALKPTAIFFRKVEIAISSVPWIDSVWAGLWNKKVPESEIEVGPIETVDPGLNQYWQDFKAQVGTSLLRDAAWLEWRYFQHPGLKYVFLLARRSGRPAGYLVYRLDDVPIGRVGYLVECSAYPEDRETPRVLLRYFLEELKAAGAVSAHALTMPGSSLHRRLRKLGFLFSSGVFDFRIVRLADTFSAGSPLSWTVQGGDFDVI
jgi:GNAT superfamily N-acetyltransferase